MKAYGLPRNDAIEHPDVGDIQEYARASHVGRFPEKGGDFRSYMKTSKKRKATRRIWKKAERSRAKTECKYEN